MLKNESYCSLAGFAYVRCKLKHESETALFFPQFAGLVYGLAETAFGLMKCWKEAVSFHRC